MEAVEAVKTQDQLNQIEMRLSEVNPIYLQIWRLGLNTALRISDLLNLTMDQLRNIDPDKRELVIVEGKTQKKRKLTFNDKAMQIISARLESNPDDKWLFQSVKRANGYRKGDEPKAITRVSVGRVLKTVGGEIRPTVQLSTHSMRKTRGHFMFKAGERIERICKVLNHSSPAITMRYLGIDQSSVDDSYNEYQF